MADHDIVETFFSKHSRYDVVRDTGTFVTKYYIWKNGRPHKGSYSSLRAAVEAAEEESGDKR